MRWRTIYIFVQHVSSRVPKGKEYSGLEPSFFVKGQGHNRPCKFLLGYFLSTLPNRILTSHRVLLSDWF